VELIASYINLVAGTGGIINTDVWATIDEQLHAHSDELGQTLQTLVQNLTPIRTGALVMDISYEAYLDPGGVGADIAYVYAEEVEQQAYWNRVYVQYQEGGILGEPTYTNDPHEMFYGVATGDGLDQTQMWAETWVQYAIDLCLAGAGIPAKIPITGLPTP
jgi:hypothetical protein